jgi:hypothetical protein
MKANAAVKMTTGEAYESIFRGRAHFAVEADDDELARLAREVVETFEADYFEGNNCVPADIQPDKALDLLAVVAVDEARIRPNLIETHKTLWGFLLNGYFVAGPEDVRKKYAQALLEWTPREEPHRSAFETMFREIRTKLKSRKAPDYDLFRWATSESSPPILRKAFQAVGVEASLDEIIFGGQCLAALVGESDPDGVASTLELIGGACIGFIEHASRVVCVAQHIRDRVLPAQFSVEHATTIQLDEKAEVVTFHLSVARQSEKSLDEEEGELRLHLLLDSVKSVKWWRIEHPAAPKFGVEICVHLMPASWEPGEEGAAERTVLEVIK